MESSGAGLVQAGSEDRGRNESKEWSYLTVVEKTALGDVITSTKALPSTLNAAV